MAQYTPLNTLKRIVKNTNTKNTLTKTKVLAQEEYNTLIKYIVENLTVNKALIYQEQFYATKYETKSRIRYYITDNSGRIFNISHIIYLLYKPYIKYLKLNVKHNYIIGNMHTVSEVYARLSNYIHSINKTIIHTYSLIPFAE